MMELKKKQMMNGLWLVMMGGRGFAEHNRINDNNNNIFFYSLVSYQFLNDMSEV